MATIKIFYFPLWLGPRSLHVRRAARYQRASARSFTKGGPVKIAIIGAGAIGGYVGVKLALAGEDVTFLVRGANLEAIRRNGMKLVSSDGREEVAANVSATNDYAAAGAQDVVILATKAH